jgi:hypothetical protein
MRFLGKRGAPVVFPQLSPQVNLYETHSDEAYLWVGYIIEIVPGKGKPFGYWNETIYRAIPAKTSWIPSGLSNSTCSVHTAGFCFSS